jgi:hypothetical protein
MESKVVCVVHPQRKSWYTKKYYADEFPVELRSTSFSESKYAQMIQKLNDRIIYDIGPVCVVLWFVFTAIAAPILSLVSNDNVTFEVVACATGAIPVLAMIWFVTKQVVDSALNAVLLETSDANYSLELDWYGRITISKLLEL